MAKRALLTIAAAIAILSAAGCVPGHYGWRCTSDDDCTIKGHKCVDFNSVKTEPGSFLDRRYCAPAEARSMNSSETYGWFTIVWFDGFFGVMALIVGYVIVAMTIDSIKRKLRRKA